MGWWLYDKFKFVFSLKTCSQQTRQCHTRFYQNGCKNENSPWTYIFYSCAIKTKKKSMGYCLVPECNHAQESLPCQFFRLFCHICETTVCWESEILLPTWRTDFSARFFRCLRFSGIKEREISVSLTNKKCFTFIKC